MGLGLPGVRSSSEYPTSSAFSTALVSYILGHFVGDRIANNFASWDKHLLNNHTFLVLTGLDAKQVVTRLPVHAVPPDPETEAYGAEGCRIKLSPRRHIALECDEPKLYVPPVYGSNINAARRVHPPGFVNCSRRQGDYTMGTKWYTHALFQMPVMRRFDFFIKLDSDLCVVGRVPVVEHMLLNGAWFAHTGHTHEVDACISTLDTFMQAYAGGSPADNTLAVYSNFVGGWLPFFQSPRMVQFSEAFRDWEGGWTHRWTDQQYWLNAIWIARAESHVLDLTFLRNRCFHHRPRTRAWCALPLPESERPIRGPVPSGKHPRKCICCVPLPGETRFRPGWTQSVVPTLDFEPPAATHADPGNDEP